MSKQKVILTFGRTLSVLVCFANLIVATGCSSLRSDSDAVNRRLARLQPGMTYREVGHVLAPADPGVREGIDEALEQERNARRDRDQVVAELRTAGIRIDPPMRSNVMIDRGDYVLVFNDGKLTSWSAR